MFKHALQPYRHGRFTLAGCALTKHPNVVGVQDTAELVRQFEHQNGVNKAAAEALKNMMWHGTRVAKHTKAFGDVVEFRLPNGLGARFHALTNTFIGFLGRGI